MKWDIKGDVNEPALQPRSTRPKMHHFTPQGQRANGINIIRQAVPITTIIGVGACFGYVVSLLNAYFKFMWLVPLACLLGPWVLPTLRAAGVVKHEPNLEGVIAGAWTAQMPDGEEDEEGRVQAPSYALFMIGARCHKPFGIFDQRFARIGKQFNAMWKELEADPNSGLLHVEGFLGTDQIQNCKLMTVGYFRTTDDVLRYSKSALHSKAWSDYHSHSQEENLYYEIYHELVEVREGRNEAIYANCRPHGLAAAWVKKTVEEKGVEHERWESTMKPAEGSMRTSMKRMGRE